MAHDSPILMTLVLGLTLAAVGGLAASKLRLPPIVGYLVAGIAIGPFTPGPVGDAALAGQLADLGIILLMFGVGLHFSLDDLLAVRRIALPGALAQILIAVALGAGVSLIWGWDLAQGLVLGLAMSCASTVVLLRALEQRNAINSVNGHIAIGWLVVEDLVMIIALMLIPALAVPNGASGPGIAAAPTGAIPWHLAVTVAKIGVFVAAVFFVGTRLVPWILQRAARTGSRELFTLTVLALAFGIAYGSSNLFGVTFALGAFFAGVVLSESDFSLQAAADSLPLKDAFAVLFFVSVGMLFDPTILLRDTWGVLVLLCVILLGKSVAAFAIVLAFGYSIPTALTVSASLAQIGEFSFILAGLATAQGLLPAHGADLILAAALLSIMLNPLVFAAVDPLGAWLRKRPWFVSRLERTWKLNVGEAKYQNHVIVIGYGRVGTIICDALQSQNVPFVIIEDNRRRVENLRKRGAAAVFGDATAIGVLEAAGIKGARLLIVAAPRGFQMQRIVDVAKQGNPTLDIALRLHSEDEVAHFERNGVGLAIMGERELALRFISYAFKRMGIPDDQMVRTVTASSGPGQAVLTTEDLPPAPELQPRR